MTAPNSGKNSEDPGLDLAKIDLSKVDLDDPQATAEAAGLRYVLDDTPGYRRIRWGRGFTYRDAEGETVRDPDKRERFAALAIPPAWTDVWICPHPDCHIQATGRDDEGRKQYRYHPLWRKVRDAAKFLQMVELGEALPELRRRADEDLSRRGLPREKVLAALVRLLETSAVRVGNEEYAEDNGSYGLTTLRKEHAEVEGSLIRFEFTGKAGKEQRVEVRDRRLARIVERCLELPGEELFQYLEKAEEGGEEPRPVDSDDVNDYLREIAPRELTAKDFRTWRASVEAFDELRVAEVGESEEERRSVLLEVVDRVAERLGNTRAVCRDFYIHPELLDSFENGSFPQRLEACVVEPEEEDPLGDLSEPERVLLLFLRHAG